MPLIAAPLGKEVTIKSCHLEGSLKHHVENLGLIPGETIMPLSQNNGNVIIIVKGCRLAITVGIASKIYVM